MTGYKNRHISVFCFLFALLLTGCQTGGERREMMWMVQSSEKVSVGKVVAVVPGVTYGQCCDHYIRIAFTLDIEKIQEGIRRITGFVNNL